VAHNTPVLQLLNPINLTNHLTGLECLKLILVVVATRITFMLTPVDYKSFPKLVCLCLLKIPTN
jgi:hypothetical protein